MRLRNNQILPDGLRSDMLRLWLKADIFRTALAVYGSPVCAVKALRGFLSQKQAIFGTNKLKLVHANGRYYWGITASGWRGKDFHRFVHSELLRRYPGREKEAHLQSMIFSITSRCPLQCEHCYEWHNLSQEETLSLQELMHIQNKVLDYGICNIQYSGGEPLSRFDVLLSLIGQAAGRSELWILTSGYGMTQERAQKLKQAGLTGVVVSLDHWLENEHNAFRGNEHAFRQAEQAIRRAHEAGLVTALSLCASRSFVSEDNLDKYLALAQQWQVGMVRILEPRQTGHYKGKDIELEEQHIRILSDFYLKHVTKKQYQAMPLIEYVGYHQRKLGCFGAGDRYLYIDSVGDVHACPFCQGAAGNALSEDLADIIPRLRETGCHKFGEMV